MPLPEIVLRNLDIVFRTVADEYGQELDGSVRIPLVIPPEMRPPTKKRRRAALSTTPKE